MSKKKSKVKIVGPTGECSTCGKIDSIRKLRVFGDQTTNGVVWYPDFLWCSDIDCYYGIAHSVAFKRSKVEHTLRDRKGGGE